jgi:uncharacterized membrane protein HdeD (DUF308 family)
MLEVCRIPTRWWTFIILGLFFLITGIVTLLWTGLVMSAISFIFSILAFTIGILLIITCIFAARYRIPWLPLLLVAFFFLVLGFISVIAPNLLAAVAIVVFAAISILIGLMMIGYGIISFAETTTRLLVPLLGLIPLAIGVYMILNTGTAAVIVVQLWGIFACILGGFFIVQGFTLRRVNYNFGCNEETIIEEIEE